MPRISNLQELKFYNATIKTKDDLGSEADKKDQFLPNFPILPAGLFKNILRLSDATDDHIVELIFYNEYRYHTRFTEI